MQIKEGVTLFVVDGNSYSTVNGQTGKKLSKVIQFNETAEWLFNEFKNREFSTKDVSNALTEQFEVDAATAETDAKRWIDNLKEWEVVT